MVRNLNDIVADAANKFDKNKNDKLLIHFIN
jgi:hypothetical protein